MTHHANRQPDRRPAVEDPGYPRPQLALERNDVGSGLLRLGNVRGGHALPFLSRVRAWCTPDRRDRGQGPDRSGFDDALRARLVARTGNGPRQTHGFKQLEQCRMCLHHPGMFDVELDHVRA